MSTKTALATTSAITATSEKSSPISPPGASPDHWTISFAKLWIPGSIGWLLSSAAKPDEDPDHRNLRIRGERAGAGSLEAFRRPRDLGDGQSSAGRCGGESGFAR